MHVIGSEFLAEAMTEVHGDDLREGDAYLHNDPYLGNTHSADHAILVPVFVDGEHVFTAVAKAHQADCGNSLATTYMAGAKDVYDEGALNFPCVRVQRPSRTTWTSSACASGASGCPSSGTATSSPPWARRGSPSAGGGRIVSIGSGGGGYGDPRERDPELVLHDVREGWVSAERAESVYGVVVTTARPASRRSTPRPRPGARA